ncbi:unnamed protein product [Meganyctiphanes norvegica]|uniref:Uncharacterized protein n=1 Tax=Meganyctiphanes norvegica TaxID=48144 RepID=A0AAV2SDM7_MEGNR
MSDLQQHLHSHKAHQIFLTFSVEAENDEVPSQENPNNINASPKDEIISTNSSNIYTGLPRAIPNFRVWAPPINQPLPSFSVWRPQGARQIPSVQSSTSSRSSSNESDDMTSNTGALDLCTITVLLRPLSLHAQQFLALCLGNLGPTLKGAQLFDVGNANKPGECFRCKEYVTEEGKSNKAIMNGLDYEGASIAKAGMLFNYGIAYLDFVIITKDDPDDFWPNPLGKVVKGMKNLHRVVRHEPISDVIITEVGIVLDL